MAGTFRFLRLWTVIFSVTAAAVGCSSGGHPHIAGEYAVGVDMSDSLSVYDLWLSVRISRDYEECTFPVNITVQSPDGRYSARDRVMFPVPSDVKVSRSGADDGVRTYSSGYFYDVECLYRTGIRPDIYGEWKITMKTPSPEYVSGFRARVQKRFSDYGKKR